MSQIWQVNTFGAKVKGHTIIKHTYTPQPRTRPKINFLHIKGQGHYGKVKSRSHNDAHLHPRTMSLSSTTSSNLRFPLYSPDKILKVKVTIARSNQGHTMTYLHS